MAYPDMTRCPQTADEFRDYFYALIGCTLGSNAGDWEAVLRKAYPWQGASLMIPPGVGPGIRQPPDAPFFGLTQQYSGAPKGRVFLPSAQADENGYYTNCQQYLDDAAGTYSEKSNAQENFSTKSGGLIWAWYYVAGHPYSPVTGADSTAPPASGGGLTEADVQAMIDDSLEQALAPLQAAIAAAVKLGDKIALRTNSGLLAGLQGGGPTEADAPIAWIGKTGDPHAWESLTLEKGE